MQIAKSITRHSIVEYEGHLYMIETKGYKKSVLLIPGEGTGRQIDDTTLLEVAYYPAELAMHFLKSEK